MWSLQSKTYKTGLIRKAEPIQSRRLYKSRPQVLMYPEMALHLLELEAAPYLWVVEVGGGGAVDGL
jgi:hypothetical protein